MLSSPAQGRRWWASRGCGAFTGPSSEHSNGTRIEVSTNRVLTADRVSTLPSHDALPLESRRVVAGFARGNPRSRQWHHAIQVAEGALDVSIWFCGDLWDHAAPSILVEEAGGQFSDHSGRRRLDTRTAIYSNGANHVEVLAAFSDS